jgi:hypothetical protein
MSNNEIINKLNDLRLFLVHETTQECISLTQLNVDSYINGLNIDFTKSKYGSPLKRLLSNYIVYWESGYVFFYSLKIFFF